MQQTALSHMRRIFRSQGLFPLRQVNALLPGSSYLGGTNGVLFRSTSTEKNPIDPDRKDAPPGTTFFTANSSYSYKDKDKAASDKYAHVQGPSSNPKPIQEDAARPAVAARDPRDRREHLTSDERIALAQPQRTDIRQDEGASKVEKEPVSKLESILGPRPDSLESMWHPDKMLQHDISHYGHDRISVMSPNLDAKTEASEKMEGFVEGFATGTDMRVLDSMGLELLFADSNEALDSDIQRYFMDRIAHIDQRTR